jgi:mono/diheme cytochrome c family protein
LPEERATSRHGSAHQPRRGLRPGAVAALILGLIAVFIALGYATVHWSAVARARKLKNPVPATPAVLADAKPLYQQHCQRCHGANGDGHGEKAPSLSVAPGDFTDASKMRRVSDGELYWQITYGRLPMPAFKDKIDEKGRWELVDYIRTFAEKNAPAASAIGATGASSNPSVENP